MKALFRKAQISGEKKVDKVRAATNSAYSAVSNAVSPLSSSASVMDSILAASK